MFYFIIGKNIHQFYPGVLFAQIQKGNRNTSTSVMRIPFFQPWLHNVF